MSLSKKQLQHVCLQYQASMECRYLGQQNGSCVCLKHMVKDKKARDKAVASFLADCKKSGADPHASWPGMMLYFGGWGGAIGIGDGAGCSGYPALSHVKQGYDQKKA